GLAFGHRHVLEVLIGQSNGLNILEALANGRWNIALFENLILGGKGSQNSHQPLFIRRVFLI
ncbi:MAG: hypothetical protein ACK56F_20210, partial [bacterium]